MPASLRVFVSYSSADRAALLELREALADLAADSIEIWADPDLVAGEIWRSEIGRRIAEADLVLALVSPAFLTSEFCVDVEIREFLARKTTLLSLLLAPCDWQRYAWLKDRQFLPGRERTWEDFPEGEARRELLAEIRRHLLEQAARLRAQREVAAPNPFRQTLPIRDRAYFIGREWELRRLRSLLSFGSAVILGGRRVGKSSLLYQIAGEWSGKKVGPVDFQGIEDLDDFYNGLARELEVPYTGWRDLRDHLRRREVLLLLDEIGAGPERGFDHQALSRFRALCQENEGFKMAAATLRPLRVLFSDSKDEDRESKGYDVFQPLFLSEFSEDEARQLLAHPWVPSSPAFSESAILEVLEISKPWIPWWVQRAAYHRWEALYDSSYDWRVAFRADWEQLT